ncbi:MAG: hydrogenase formation protein HypD [Actinomycetota bacterium]|nr:hydrogenase formation protein HypD [Actinomycetota bacterium]
MKLIEEYRNPAVMKELAEKVKELGVRSTLMEVCGTHTMAISRFGLRSFLPPEVDLVSGPGCPVCVTADRDIDRAIALSAIGDVTLATFGDMVRVPGSRSSLQEASASGANVKVVYSPLEALEMAKSDRERKIVFLGIGFETTAPAVAATIIEAKRENINNFFVLSLHKLVPPALRALAELPDFHVDGFILPGHVSTIIGSKAYEFLASEYGIPGVIAGFEPTDVMRAIYMLLRMQKEEAEIAIEYTRAVKPNGNRKAIETMHEVFEPCDAEWRGLFRLAGSGLLLRENYKEFDAGEWEVDVPPPLEKKGCRCGDVLCGRIKPMECGLFGKTCTPETPVGPCMVSSEGTCASYYLYCDE